MSEFLEDAIARLPRGSRDRLAQFAAEFEDVDPLDYWMFATAPSNVAGVNLGAAAVADALPTGPRRDAVREVVAAFTNEAAFRLSRHNAIGEFPPGIQWLPDRAADRARFFGSLEGVVVGLVLWDEVAPDVLAVLLGPWAEKVERAIGPADGAPI